MSVQISIIGLGQIGASVGLALADKTNLLRRVGHDRSPEVARRAEKIGALDKVEFNLLAAVRNADLVLLAVPMDQVRETLDLIAAELKEGAVVMDTAPVKSSVIAWTEEHLPPGRYYIGLTPVINPAYLLDAATGVEAAHADLFHSGVMAIVAPSRSNSEAIKLATDFTQLVGSAPLFIDPLEVDSLMSAIHLLPHILAVALLHVTVDQPGWREARKLAGKAYAKMTGLATHQGEMQGMGATIMDNRENTLRMMDRFIAALQAIRQEVEDGDAGALEEDFALAQAGREKWWRERQSGDWLSEELPRTEIPKGGDMFSRLLGIGRKPRSGK